MALHSLKVPYLILQKVNFRPCLAIAYYAHTLFKYAINQFIRLQVACAVASVKHASQMRVARRVAVNKRGKLLPLIPRQQVCAFACVAHVNGKDGIIISAVYNHVTACLRAIRATKAIRAVLCVASKEYQQERKSRQNGLKMRVGTCAACVLFFHSFSNPLFQILADLPRLAR